MIVLRRGASGETVRAWQKILGGVSADGVFGPQTEDATKAWQSAHGLEPDGVVGPETWRAAGIEDVTLPAAVWPSVRAAFVPFTAPLEGVVPHLYCDVLGLVTIAIGCLVDPIETALGLPLVHADGRDATRNEIADEWRLVKAHKDILAKHGHRAAAQYCKLHLTDEGVDLVVGHKLDSVIQNLCGLYPELPRWPADAQLGAISMAWACGEWFHRKGFTTLRQALLEQDWIKASQSCHINTTGNPGVAHRNDENARLFTLAAWSVKNDIDASALAWGPKL